jgi:hypothetical protein
MNAVIDHCCSVTAFFIGRAPQKKTASSPELGPNAVPH